MDCPPSARWPTGPMPATRTHSTKSSFDSMLPRDLVNSRTSNSSPSTCSARCGNARAGGRWSLWTLCGEIEAVENASGNSGAFGELLVVFGHEEVDHIGHGSAEALIRHVDLEIRRLALLIRRLHRWGYPEVHVITDHGFILLDEEKLPP